MPVNLDLPADDRDVGTPDPPEDVNRLIRAAAALATAHNAHETATTTALAGKVGTSDPRLTDARTPTAHKHVQADVTDLPGITIDTTVGTRVFVGSGSSQVMVHGSTGQREVLSWLDPAWEPVFSGTPSCWVWRNGEIVSVAVRVKVAEDASILGQSRGGYARLLNLESGFRPVANASVGAFWFYGAMADVTTAASVSYLSVRAPSGVWGVGDIVAFTVTYPVGASWPTTLPGTPA